MLELALNRAGSLPALDPSQIFFQRQCEQEAVKFRIIETTPKVGKLPFSPPDMLDDEVSSETPVMMNEHFSGSYLIEF